MKKEGTAIEAIINRLKAKMKLCTNPDQKKMYQAKITELTQKQG